MRWRDAIRHAVVPPAVGVIGTAEGTTAGVAAALVQAVVLAGVQAIVPTVTVQVAAVQAVAVGVVQTAPIVQVVLAVVARVVVAQAVPVAAVARVAAGVDAAASAKSSDTFFRNSWEADGMPHTRSGLDYIRAEVRQQPAIGVHQVNPDLYRLQWNENPFDFPADLKEEVLTRLSAPIL